MQEISIRQLQEKDTQFAYDMNVAEEWNDRIEDIKRMLSFEPNGCFIAEVKGNHAGHVFTVNYGRLAWIGLLIVKAQYRNMGIGTRLMEEAKNYLLHCKVKTIELDAVPEIAELYRKLGFIDEYDSLRYRGTCKNISSLKNNSVTPMKSKDIPEVAKFDAEYFGAERTRVLNKLYEENTDTCFVAHDDSRITGYIMHRKARSGHWLGPCACEPDDPETARQLFAEGMNMIGLDEQIYVGVPAVNKAAVDVMRRLGFERYSKSVRMRSGEEPAGDTNGIFALGGPMKG
jgi:predicted N-acetyltransferase YhbS